MGLKFQGKIHKIKIRNDNDYRKNRGENNVEWYEKLIRAGKEKVFYSSYAWTSLAAEIKKDNHFECLDCKKKGLYAPAEEVHHVDPIKHNPARAMDRSNLVPLCRDCHHARHGGNRNQKIIYTKERW